MATYTELFGLNNNSDLRNKITVACIVAAEKIRVEVDTAPNHANRLTWAIAVFANPAHEAERLTWAVLAQNRTAQVADITGASDATIQTAVDAAVNVFATG